MLFPRKEDILKRESPDLVIENILETDQRLDRIHSFKSLGKHILIVMLVSGLIILAGVIFFNLPPKIWTIEFFGFIVGFVIWVMRVLKDRKVLFDIGKQYFLKHVVILGLNPGSDDDLSCEYVLLMQKMKSGPIPVAVYNIDTRYNKASLDDVGLWQEEILDLRLPLSFTCKNMAGNVFDVTAQISLRGKADDIQKYYSNGMDLKLMLSEFAQVVQRVVSTGCSSLTISRDAGIDKADLVEFEEGLRRFNEEQEHFCLENLTITVRVIFCSEECISL